MLILFNEINKKFDNNNCNFVKINNQDFKEIFDFNYQTEIQDDILNKKINPASLADKIEREKLLEKVKSGIDYLLFDKHSRQFVIQMEYDEREDLAGCLSLMQFIIRDNVLHLFVFVRSQHFDRNFLYDNQTYMLLTKTLRDDLKKNKIIIENEEIHVHITSLHKEKKSKKNKKKPLE
ncbi:hypothetical protein CL617_00970 [archaeon]|nr:hypothetical protein [archaeon]